MGYNGTIELIAGVKPANNGNFPMVNAKDVYVDDDTRLDAKLNGLDDSIDDLNAAVVTDATLSQTGKPADAKAVGDAINNITIEVDATLSQTGKAADAKATGDAVGDLKTQLNDIADIKSENNFDYGTDQTSPIRDVTITYNADGTMTFNGTSTGQVRVHCKSLPAGTYTARISCISGTLDSSILLRETTYSTTWCEITPSKQTSDDVTITRDAEFDVWVTIPTGVTLTNCKVSVFIAEGSKIVETSSANDKKAREDIVEIDTELDRQADLLAEISIPKSDNVFDFGEDRTSPIRDVTILYNADKTLTYNGTSTGQVRVKCATLPAGTYTARISCISGTFDNPAILLRETTYSTTWCLINPDKLTSDDVTITRDSSFDVWVTIPTGVTLTNCKVSVFIAEGEDIVDAPSAIDLVARADIEELESKISGTLPDYWKTYLTSKAPEINDAMNDIGGNGDSFIFFTDPHWGSRNQKHTPAIIKNLIENTSLRSVYCGGDLRDHSTGGFTAYAKAFNDITVFTARGNHDQQPNAPDEPIAPDPEYYNMILKPIEYLVDTKGQIYYYRDNKSEKIRYIFMDSGSPRLGTLTAAQLEWMQNALTELESGWSALIIQHVVFSGNYADVPTLQYADAGTALINAINAVWNDMQCTLIGVLSGHVHRDYYDFNSAHGYPIVMTSCDVGSTGRTESDPDNPVTPGTTDEHILDVFNIDKVEHTFSSIRIGAGVNRIFHYIPVTESGSSVSLTSKLSGTLTWSSNDTNVATVSNGTVSKVTSGAAFIKATDENGNFEIWDVIFG